jgi:pimeloyl-ACP methyl ester carboxylesterase
MKVYFIPGLGADKRVFRHICLPEGFDMIHLDWLRPEADEKLVHYAERLAGGIDMNEPWSVVGLSFGGMLASEISRQFTPKQTILIASVPASEHLPRYFKFLAPLNLHKILPMKIFTNASLAKRLFTAETREDKILLRRIIRETDHDFIRWALGAILGWKGGIGNKNDKPDFFHIHGTKDILLPVRYVQPTHFIEGGGHLMIMNRAGEINTLLNQILTRQ